MGTLTTKGQIGASASCVEDHDLIGSILPELSTPLETGLDKSVLNSVRGHLNAIHYLVFNYLLSCFTTLVASEKPKYH